MNALDLIALIFIPVMIIFAAAGIVFPGSLPGKIARGRNHPWPEAVNAASWIGLTTGILWPFAFVWAFLPLPASSGTGGSGSGLAPPRSGTRLEACRLFAFGPEGFPLRTGE